MLKQGFQCVSLKRTILEETKERNCLNSSSLAFVSPLAFHWTHLKLLGGIRGWWLFIGVVQHFGRGVCPGCGVEKITLMCEVVGMGNS